MLAIKILGSGCANCRRLEQLVEKVLDQLNVEANLSKVTNPVEYSDYGVMATPALVINERTVCSGRVPSMLEVGDYVKAAATDQQTG